MGSALTPSIDMYATYPLVRRASRHLSLVHPNYITALCIFFKYCSIYTLQQLQLEPLVILMLIERFLDCLDGEVARRYQKCSRIGHCLDKYSDVAFRLAMIYYCLYYSVVLFQLSVYWFLLVGLTLWCPFIYILDYRRGALGSDLECSSQCWAVYIEDNAVAFCFILPWLLYRLV